MNQVETGEDAHENGDNEGETNSDHQLEEDAENQNDGEHVPIKEEKSQEINPLKGRYEKDQKKNTETRMTTSIKAKLCNGMTDEH